MYQNLALADVCKFMRRCDMNVGDICIKEVFVFTASKEIPIDEIKDNFMKGFKESGCDIFSIEGGKIE